LAEFFKSQLQAELNTENILLKSTSKADLKSLFSIDSQGNVKKNNSSGKEAINFELFLDSLALASMHNKTHEECTEIEKIIFLAEKMSQSKGVDKSQLRSGHTL
jgi:hypothetical protein